VGGGLGKEGAEGGYREAPEERGGGGGAGGGAGAGGGVGYNHKYGYGTVGRSPHSEGYTFYISQAEHSEDMQTSVDSDTDNAYRSDVTNEYGSYE